MDPVVIKVWIEDEEASVYTLTLLPYVDHTLIYQVPAKYWSGSLTVKFNIRTLYAEQTKLARFTDVLFSSFILKRIRKWI